MKRFITIQWAVVFILLSWTLLGCSKMNDPYKKFIEGGEITYTKKVDTIAAFPGNNRIKLLWVVTEAPNVTQYLIRWRNQLDSLLVPVSNPLSDSTSVIVEGLNEGNLTFTIYTRDKDGHTSVGREITTSVYGPTYHHSLTNRKIQRFSSADGVFQAFWYQSDTTHLFTEVKYTDTSGVEKLMYFPADSTMLEFPGDYDPVRMIYLKSSYKPVDNAIDTFAVAYYDSLKATNIPVSKRLWEAVSLPNDAAARNPDNSMDWIWDGLPGGFPQIFYTDGVSMPCTFTFDLGEEYDQLTQMEEWGRSQGYNNPKSFEVWGIADTTGASTLLLPTDSGWVDESLAKGWTLMAEVFRNDNGIAGWKTDLAPGHPPVRYIRLRILETTTGSAAVHLSELSFWYNP